MFKEKQGGKCGWEGVAEKRGRGEETGDVMGINHGGPRRLLRGPGSDLHFSRITPAPVLRIV